MASEKAIFLHFPKILSKTESLILIFMKQPLGNVRE
jgi:hypothetical protein